MESGQRNCSIRLYHGFQISKTCIDAARTLPVGIAQFMSLRPGMAQTTQAFGTSMAGAVIAAVPPIIVFFILQRYFIRGISMTGIKG